MVVQNKSPSDPPGDGPPETVTAGGDDDLPADPPVEDTSFDRKVRRQLVNTGRSVLDGAKKTPGLVNDQFADWMDTAVTKLIERELDDWKRYVATLRSQNGGINDDDLAKLIIRRRATKNGAVGAATGVWGVMALPVTVPADVAASYVLQIRTALAIAVVYGHDEDSLIDLKTDIFLILAGDTASEALKRLGVEAGKHVTKKAVQKHVTREVMKKIWRVVPQRILTKAGEKSATSFMRLVPVVGAPIGFAFNYTAARVVGSVARHYYSGQA